MNDYLMELTNYKNWYLHKADKKPVTKHETIEGWSKLENAGSYKEMMELFQHNKYYVGFSFFPRETPYVCIDIDKCIFDGKITKGARELVETFDSYTEYSPSGTGLHIWIKADLQKDIPTVNIEDVGGVEVFKNSKILTITEQIMHEKPISERQSKLDELCGHLKAKKCREYNERVIGYAGDRLEGDRHNKLMSLLGNLRKNGISEKSIRETVKALNNSFDKPLTEQDLEQTIFANLKNDFAGDYKSGITQEFLNKGLLTVESALEEFEQDTIEKIELENFPQLTKKIKLKKNDHLVLGADTGGGKTALALNWINSLSKTYPILYFNLEMSNVSVIKRLIGINAGIKLDELEKHKDDLTVQATIKNQLEEITSRKTIRIYDTCNIKDIEKIIKHFSADEMQVVFIDHVLLMQNGRNQGNYEKFTAISNELRQISKRENIVLILLCQLNRESKKTNEPPTLGAYKESGSIENDATHCLFIWKDKIIVRKNRNGTIDSNESNFINIYFDKENQRIKELSRDMFESKPEIEPSGNRRRRKKTS